MTRDLLYYYCGGGPTAVQELLVSLHSLIRSNPRRGFRVGLGLDQQAADLFDWRAAESKYGVIVHIVPTQPDSELQGKHAFHVINRWRGLTHFSYDRVLILDIDTIVNLPLDPLFSLVHPDPGYFTTFASLSERASFRLKHKLVYDSLLVDYAPPAIYCSIGLHAISQGWPHLDQMIRYCRAVDTLRRQRRMHRVFVEEYSLNMLLLQNGRKVHFPQPAIRSSRRMDRRESPPHVWHFVLNCCRANQYWQQALTVMQEEQFLAAKTSDTRALLAGI